MKKMIRTLSLVIILSLSNFAFASNFAIANATNILNGKIVNTNQFENNDDFVQIVASDYQNNTFMNYPQGYSINYPSNMFVDVSMSKLKTTFCNSENILEIYHDEFTDANTYASYVNYSNKFLQVPGHVIDEQKNSSLRGHDVHVLKWHRNKLSTLEKDYNYYAVAEIKKNNKDVYTLFLKSTGPINGFDYLISTFDFIPKKGTPKINTTFEVDENNFNEPTKEFYDKYLSDDANLKFGIFENSAPADMTYLNHIESMVNYEFPVIVRYQELDTQVPIKELEKAANENKVVELTMQTVDRKKDSKLITYEILDGKYDAYFTEYARKLKEFNKPVLFRLDNEMNGDWCSYSSFYNSKDAKLFRDKWIHIHDIFKQNGADNVIWVWNPHDRSFPNFKWNHYLNYYPGDKYVDVIGLTGYNTGNYYPGETWRSFEEVYDDMYTEYSTLFNQPLMITEFASSTYGGDKVAWINDMFNKFYKYPDIKLAIWWNGIDWDKNGNPARVYKMDNDTKVIEAFKNGLSNYK